MEVQIPSSLVLLVFEGEDFVLRAFAEAFASSLFVTCNSCAPGTSVDLGGAFNSPSVGGGSAVVDGVSYPLIHLDMTGTFVTPPILVEGSQTVTLSAPFTYSGTILGFLEHPFTRGADVPPVFAKSLVGSGQASATFVFVDLEELGPTFTATDLRYDFADAEPIPEPATIVLVVSGAAVLAARRRRTIKDR